ncbi:hypothetical protein K458DRAFT_417604 [Lentithecium fluviatile CBS 122367]|uniref:F-box domain-containing protein n=1 Tax=Lentithecium fluviatile CBS 122367 TaxID=1168545 RepID=A0A6G1J2I9_9PLEO|nr:hypothetical protein K458DRAFT_417604 [Lentithecium fluviatile CBS 122367]
MSSAQARVIATAELLEAILAQLPPRYLLLAQRISHRFQHAIATSPRLQQLLFFRTAPTKDPKQWSLNPILRGVFVPWFVMPGNRWAMPTYESLEILNHFNDAAKADAILTREASWRQMPLVRPSPKALTVVKILYSRGYTSADVANLSFEHSPSGGVTMGAIYDITESFLRESFFSSFSLSILDSESGPQITLYLHCSVQCCRQSETTRKRDLRSRDAEVLVWDLDFVRGRDEDGGGRYFDGNPPTDLSVERGGVNFEEFQAWQRERAPISSMVSDVR